MKSIGQRIHRAIFAVSLISIVIIIVSVWVVDENLEITMLRGTPVPQAAGLVRQPGVEAMPFVWDDALNKIAFVPSGAALPDGLPALFDMLDGRSAAELHVDGQTWLINVSQGSDGSFYWARNISAFEARQKGLVWSLLLVAVAIALFSLGLALFSSRRIVQPLRRLSTEIGNLPVGKNMPAINQAYEDGELHDIATAFNRFLGELNAYVDREQRLLSLASHELRTPIAVVAGALDVIDSRQQLRLNDALTLARIRKANREMADNVDTLLRLSRNLQKQEMAQQVAVTACLRDVLIDLDTQFDVHLRVSVDAPADDDVCVEVAPAMLRMLLRNLVQNALQHTSGSITVVVRADSLVIRDQGSEAIPLAGSPAAGRAGLGLYIVTLICERLQWPLKVSGHPGGGNQVVIDYS